MSLSYETHASTGTPLLKADENLIETLEDNQVCLPAAECDMQFALFFQIAILTPQQSII